MNTRKEVVVQFLTLVIAGRIEEAYRQHVDPKGKHHNPYYPAGFPSLQTGMIENHSEFPNKQITVNHVLGDGDFVAAHSHVVLSAGEKEFATVHLFRFQGERIVEMWDVAQPLPADSPNADGMF